jgi:predicted Zn-dependent peptidase
MKMKVCFSLLFLCFFTANAGFKLTQYENDPLGTWHYTLDNGLEVFLTENHEKPVFYSEIVVRAGSSSDPAESTGIAHYLEHMLFKGTDRFGTADYASEKPLLDKITLLYEDYRATADVAERKAIMGEISDLSARAATYAIPNEFDRMYQQLGGTRINAHTSNEETVYKVQCPTSSFKQWCLIESERFRNPVFRLFQTEIEAVYEEKNGSLDSKERALYQSFLASMYKVHPYGQQSTLGTVEHLKSPSIKDMYEFYGTYYVPNNMAIIISGDINPAEAIKLIDRYFSHWQTKELPIRKTWQEAPLNGQEVVDIDFPGQEQLMMGFRTVESGHEDESALKMFDMILDNSQAGLINMNINQKLLAQRAGCYPMMLNDYGNQTFYGIPKKGQSLDEVKDLILQQIEKVKKGEFEEWLLPAILADFTKNQQAKLEDNSGRVEVLRDLFIGRTSISSYALELEEMAKVTKKKVVDAANKYFGENYLLVKRHDKEIQKVKMEKPDFKPIESDANRFSPFAERVKITPKAKDKPQFVDLSKDITIQDLPAGIKIYSVKNPINKLFDLSLIFPIGEWHDDRLPILAELFNNGFWSGKTTAELKRDLYSKAGQYNMSVGRNETVVSIGGLDSTFAEVCESVFTLMNQFETTKERLDEQAAIILDKKQKALKDPSSLSYMTSYYGRYKEGSPFRKGLRQVDYDKLEVADIQATAKKLFSYKFKATYAGSLDIAAVEKSLEHLKLEGARLEGPAKVIYDFPKTTKPLIYFYDFDTVQTRVRMEFPGELYSTEKAPIYHLFNEYFDGSLGSVVFQEMREKRALAYSAWSRFYPIGKKDEKNLMIAGITCQADKTIEAIKAFRKIIFDVPFDAKRFQVAKGALLSQQIVNRIGFRTLAAQVIQWEKLGLKEDPSKANISAIRKKKLKDLEEFASSKIAGNEFIISIVGDKKRLDMKALAEFGEIIELSSEDIRGK